MWIPCTLGEAGVPPPELGLQAPKGELSPGKLLLGCESQLLALAVAS